MTPQLAAANRRHHDKVDEFLISMDPHESDRRQLSAQLRSYDLVIAGTINATPGQAALVKGLIQQGTPLIAIAMRMPYDLSSYPAVETYLCTYSILSPSMEAVADAMWGKEEFAGRLPVTI